MIVRLVSPSTENKVLCNEDGNHCGRPIRYDRNEVFQVGKKVGRCLDANRDNTEEYDNST